MPRGKFIAFCGGEGAGKTTQIKHLAQHLADRGKKVLLTREPGGTPAGQQLRKLLLTAGAAPRAPRAATPRRSAGRPRPVPTGTPPARAAGADAPPPPSRPPPP